MLYGKSGEKISLCTESNGHLLNLGTSGSGKSFYIYQRLQELWLSNMDNRRFVVIDYSNSFTPDEMAKARFSIDVPIFYIDLTQRSYSISIGKDNNNCFRRMLADILADVFRIKSYPQKAALLEYCQLFMDFENDTNEKSLSSLFTAMTNDLKGNANQDKQKRENIWKLLDRLEILEQCRIGIRRDISFWKEGIHIVQLSNLSRNERNLYTNLLLRLYWHQICNFKSGYFSTYVIEEFQHLDLSLAVEEFLREGRKFGASVILSSQYIGEEQKKFIPALKQAANQMYFHPVDSDLQALAQMIDAAHSSEWKKILSGLQTGQAVLCGNYRVNENRKILQRPIIVNVSENNEN